MRPLWFALVSLSIAVPCVGRASPRTAPIGTRSLKDLSFRPSSTLPRDEFKFPMRQPEPTADTARNRLLFAINHLASPTFDALASHGSLESAVAAKRPQAIEDAQRWYPDRLRDRLARKLTRHETEHDQQRRVQVDMQLDQHRRTLSDQVHHLDVIDEELAKLPTSVTGGLRIGEPWGSPLMHDWNGLRRELLGVVHQLDQRDPPQQPAARPTPTRAPTTQRPVAIRREMPGLFYRLGDAVLQTLDPEYARQTLVWRRQHPRSF